MVRKDLLDAIRAVHAGRRSIPPEIAADIVDHVSGDSLTDREIQVLRQVAAGRANKEAAAQLRISEETIKAHMKSILAKLAANDRTHAVMIVRRGIIEA